MRFVTRSWLMYTQTYTKTPSIPQYQDDGPSFDDRTMDETIRLSIIDAFPQMRSLRKVWMEDELLSEPPIMAHLASLPTLEELCMDSHYSHPDVKAPQTSMPFSSLRTLYLTGLCSPYDPPGEFLSSIEPRSLESLTFMWIHSYSDERTGMNYLRNFLSILSTTGALQLQNLKATYCRDEKDLEQFLIEYGMPPGALRCVADVAKDLRPLCNLTSLRNIELEIDVVLQLRDDFLTQLATCLPHLERLSLMPGIVYAFRIANLDEAELPTFTGVLALVEHCPHLTVLKLAVRSAIPSEGDDHTALLSAFSMQALDLLATPIDESIELNTISAFLVFTFPNLERLRIALPVADDEDFSMEKRENACARWSSVIEDVLAAQGAGGKETTRLVTGRLHYGVSRRTDGIKYSTEWYVK